MDNVVGSSLNPYESPQSPELTPRVVQRGMTNTEARLIAMAYSGGLAPYVGLFGAAIFVEGREIPFKEIGLIAWVLACVIWWSTSIVVSVLLLCSSRKVQGGFALCVNVAAIAPFVYTAVRILWSTY
jgi:hypothetical protein